MNQEQLTRDDLEALGVTIPMLEGETAKAYDARLHYMIMGKDRSIKRLAQEQGRTSSDTILEGWSSRFGWVEQAQKFDQLMGDLMARRRAEDYIAEVEQYRADYNNTGKALLDLGNKMLERYANSVDTLELTPQLLNATLRAITLSADLRANVLQLDDLIGRLSVRDDSEDLDFE